VHDSPQERKKIRLVVQLKFSKGGGRNYTLSMAQASKVCPECGYEFQGNGWDGIDAHWRANHAQIMAYEEAWPLISAGKYPRNREDFSQAAERIVREATEKTQN
jgi:hypothetical protein